MFYRELIYQAVIFSAIKPMEQKKSELTLPSKMQNTQFRQRKTILTRGIVITGCIRNVIWLSVFSIKSKLFAELLLVMISLLHRFLLSYTSLPFGFCLNDTTLLSFQIRSNYKGTYIDLIIPDTIEGYPVTSIGRAFENKIDCQVKCNKIREKIF